MRKSVENWGLRIHLRSFGGYMKPIIRSPSLTDVISLRGGSNLFYLHFLYFALNYITVIKLQRQIKDAQEFEGCQK